MYFLHIFDLYYHVNIVRLKIEYNPLLRQGFGIPALEEDER